MKEHTFGSGYFMNDRIIQDHLQKIYLLLKFLFATFTYSTLLSKQGTFMIVLLF